MGDGLGWVGHPFFRHHRTGADHPESPLRLEVIEGTLEGLGLLDRMTRLPFAPASHEDLAVVHHPAYVELLRLACEHGFGYVAEPETRICPESFEVARLAAGGTLAAVDAVLHGTVGRAFCGLRPPGHHAGPERAGGFCLVNHAALAAEHALRRRGLGRVAVVDLDAHHGNGTQEIFWERGDVLYVSLHEHPLTLKYPGTGWPGETGAGRGRGRTRNVCLAHGAGDAELLAALESEVIPALEAFRPDLLVLSVGFDGLATDPLTHLTLTAGGFGKATARLVDAAEGLCGGRIVSVLEGGYDLVGLGPAVAAHVEALLGA
ncbi:MULTISPECIES: histone deacetylase family protein [Deferrisoma]